MTTPSASRWWSLTPLTVLVLGLPLWWLLGVQEFLPLLVAIGLAWHLWRGSRRLYLPPGTAPWLLFLVWVVLGVAVLGADAPGAVAGGDGVGRLLVYGYRLMWYLACTTVLLWIGNSSRERVPDHRVHGVLGALFLIATAGGLLGLLAPQLEFPSALELLLPEGLRSNAFVVSLVHAEVADVHQVLGHPSPRPKAPFAFTNTWGSVMALSLVFLVAYAVRAGWRVRVTVATLVAVASVPIVFSLNRGLWGCLVLGGAALVVLALTRLRADRAALLLGGFLLAAVVMVVSPLTDVVTDRWENPHSNDRRGQLLSVTVSSVSTGSPVVGFGTTRDVEGSFASIAGGATPDCPACGVPPLGTQGHLWLVLFSQGWLGLAFFVWFLGTWLVRSWRCRSLNEIVATIALTFFALQILVYDTLGLPLLLVMVAIGLVWREQRAAGAVPTWTRGQLSARSRRWLAPVAVAVLLGAVAGWQFTPDRTRTGHVSEAWIALTPVPVYLSAGLGTLGPETDEIAAARDITIDTEAALLRSEGTLQRVGAGGSESTTQLRESLTVSAVPLTDLLVVRLRTDRRDDAAPRVEDVARSYLATRESYLERRRETAITDLRTVIDELPAPAPGAVDLSQRLNDAINRLSVDKRSVGRVVKVVPAAPAPPPVAVIVASGAGLGLLVGLLLAVAIRWLDPWTARWTGRPRPRPTLHHHG